MAVDLPVEVDYSGYRLTPGAGQVAFHVERRIGGRLDLRFDIERIKFNTGLPASDFTLH